MAQNGYLILENGQIFEGLSFGFDSDVDGEVVFNTGMVGYPESFTDPSYFGQILVMTYPLIGNYGVPEFTKSRAVEQYFESERIQIRGLIVANYVDNNSHWQARQTLEKWLKSDRVPALSGIDTRTLTQILRSSGVMKGKITFTKPRKDSGFIFYDINRDNLVGSVSTGKIKKLGNGNLKILVLDCGLKNNQIRIFLAHKVSLIIVPWNFDPFEDKKLKFDGLFITNGPGDPKIVKKTIYTVRQALSNKIPTLGICLGNQILALAAGADTYKMKFGHRSQNQPVRDESTGKCFITTHNHGYTVDTKSIPAGWKIWFTNLNDGTCEGIKHTNFPFLGCQFHPEASPGPTDTEWIFEYFIKLIRKWINH